MYMEAREIIEKSSQAVAPAAVIDLDIVHGRVSGTVIAPEFETMTHLERQRTVRNRVVQDLGPDADELGMLLFYTPAEAEAVNLAGKAAQINPGQGRRNREIPKIR
jgi:hypothetical protein